MAYNVYSLPDCRTVLYHPDVGTANLHQSGHGKITGNDGDGNDGDDPFRSPGTMGTTLFVPGNVSQKKEGSLRPMSLSK